MKKGMLILLLMSSVFAEAQSIKEALFRGKLKNDPGTVIRKGDDLSTKMVDTTKKAAVDSTKKALITGMPDSSNKSLALQPDSSAVAGLNSVDSSSGTADSAATTVPADPSKDASATTKENNALWKTYVDSVSNTVKAEALSSKKIKKGTYYVTVSYAIGTDGQVTINDVFVTPENAYLHSQIKDRLELEAPRLSPVLSSNGTPRKVNRKYNFTIVKE